MRKRFKWKKTVALILALVMLQPGNTIFASDREIMEDAVTAEAEITRLGNRDEVATALQSTAAELASHQPGEDYVEHQAFFSAKSREEAERIAREYGAELDSFMDGIAVIRFDQTVAEMMNSAAAERNVSKPVCPDYIVEAFGEIPEMGNQDVQLPVGYGAEAETTSVEDVRAAVSYTDPHYVDGWQWFHDEVGDSYAHSQGITGKGIKVAVIDTGITRGHEELGNYKGGYDFVNNDTDPSDDAGHGTHCCGIIGAKGNNGKGGMGVAPDVSLYAYKVLGANGRGNTSNIVRAVNRAVSDGVNVISMSLGGPDYLSEFQAAINNAREKGIVVVAAAGNDHTSEKAYPGAYDNVLCVAAMPGKGSTELSKFSNFGDWVDIVAPGGSSMNSGFPEEDGSNAATDIFSTYHLGSNRKASKSGYFCMSGTSMACPVVSGIVALVMSANRGLTAKSPEMADQVMSIMMGSKNTTTYSSRYGSVTGMAQVQPAVDAAKALIIPSIYKVSSPFGFRDSSRIIIGGSLQLKITEADGSPAKGYGKVEWSSDSDSFPVTKGGKVSCLAGTEEGTRSTVTATFEDGTTTSYSLYATKKSVFFGILRKTPFIGESPKLLKDKAYTSQTVYVSTSVSCNLMNPYALLTDYGELALEYIYQKTKSGLYYKGYYANTGFDYKITVPKKNVGKEISVTSYQRNGDPGVISFASPGTYTVKYQTVDGSNKSFTVKFIVLQP